MKNQFITDHFKELESRFKNLEKAYTHSMMKNWELENKLEKLEQENKVLKEKYKTKKTI